MPSIRLNHDTAADWRRLATVQHTTTYRPPKYATDRIVDELHAYYHHGGAKDFAPDDRAYQIAVGGFFGLPLAIGIIMVLSFGAFQVIMSCCGCACCKPKANWGRRRCVVATLLVANAALMMCSWVGRNDMQGAATVAMRLISNDQKSGLADIFKELDAASKKLDLSGKSIASTVTSLTGVGGCDAPTGPWAPGPAGDAKKLVDKGVYNSMIMPLKTQLGAQAGKFGDAGKMMTQMFGGIGPKLDLLTKVPLSLYVDMGLGATVAQMLGVLFVGLAGLMCGSACFLTMSTGQGTGMLASITVIVAAEVFMSVLLADVCTFGPMKAINSLAAKFLPGKEAKMPRDLVSYFTTCNGSNPVAAPLSQAMAGIAMLNSKLAPLTSSTYPGSGAAVCNVAKVQAVLNATNATSSSMATIINVMGCDHINPIMSNFTNELLCKSVVHGLYHLWVVQASASCFLFVNLFLLWKVKFCLARPSEYATPMPVEPDDPKTEGGVNASGNESPSDAKPAAGLRGRMAAKAQALKEKMDAKAAANLRAAVAKEEGRHAKEKEKALAVLAGPTPAKALAAALEPATATASLAGGRRGSVARKGIPEAEISLVVDDGLSNSSAAARYPGSKSVICNSRPLLVGFRATSGAIGATVDTFGRGPRGEIGACEVSGQVFPGDSLLCVVCAAVGTRDTARLPFTQVQVLLRDAQCPLELVFGSTSGGGKKGWAELQRQRQQQQQEQQQQQQRRNSHRQAAAKPSPMMLRLQARKREVAMLRMFFEEIDSDGSGSMQRDELVGVLEVLGLQSVDGAMHAMDGDHDGKVSFSEFLTFMTAQAKLGFDLSALIMDAPLEQEGALVATTPVAHVFV
jgi:hypothetical protein